MARRSGLSTVPAGADATRYYKGIKQDRALMQRGASKSPEQLASDQEASAKRQQDFLRSAAPSWGIAPEDVELFVTDSHAYREMIDQRAAKERATAKIEDQKARIAVEGDTDLNHDNVEAAE